MKAFLHRAAGLGTDAIILLSIAAGTEGTAAASASPPTPRRQGAARAVETFAFVQLGET